MLRPSKMSKVRAICLKQVAPSLISSLHNLSVLHIKETHIKDMERSGPLASYDEISSRLIRIRSMMETMGKEGKLPKRKAAIRKPLGEADELLAEFEKLQEIIKVREEIRRELDTNLAQQKSISELSSLNVDFSQLSSSSLQFILLKVNADKAKQAVAKLSKKKNQSHILADGLLLVALPKKDDAKSLEAYGQVVPIPLISTSPKQELSALKSKEAKIRERLEKQNRRVSRFTDQHYAHAVAIEEELSIEAERARLATFFCATDSLYYIEGWVESSRFKPLESELHKRFGKKILVSESAPGHHEMPPTKLSNPALAGPFQFLVGLVSLPRYSEIDPSMFLALIIPLLYALILGDAGYALLSFFMASYLVKKSAPGGILNQVASIWRISAIPAFIMGIFFDEWFGFTHAHLLEKFGVHSMQLYQGFYRVESIQTLMFITILIGMTHLALGFILGAINEWNHSRKHAIAKLCWLGIEIAGFFLVAVYMFNTFVFLSLPALFLFLLCAAGLFWSEGPVSLFEIPGLASNIMSYIRIAAVGVGGVILAEAINELLFPHLELSPLGILFFAITAVVYLAIHAVSCMIAMFESFVHGARLNVVEFFGKFYNGNGLAFSPFSVKRLYTEEA